MIFTPMAVAGAYVIEPERVVDDRGFFLRSFCADSFAAHGLNPRVVQCNISWNRVKGTLRGLHYQVAPHAETKVVRCTRGAIWDVVADLRPGSVTYLQWAAAELTAANHRQLYIPEGVAHGFVTLADDSEVFYLMGSSYVEGAARGVAWDDPGLAIQWPMPPTVISEADRKRPTWDMHAPGNG